MYKDLTINELIQLKKEKELELNNLINVDTDLSNYIERNNCSEELNNINIELGSRYETP